MIRRLVLYAIIFRCLSATPALLGVQNSTTDGTLSGSVMDVSGAFVPGAVVTVRSVDTNQIRRVTTADDGSYRFISLPVGNYAVQVEVRGFATYTNNAVTVALGRTTFLDIR